MAKKKNTSKLKGGQATKAWRMVRDGQDYKTIGQVLGYTSTAIKAYAMRKYRQESTKLWADEIKMVGQCEIYGCTRTDDLNAHHLLEKSHWTHLRYDLSNGVCLCSGHHTMDRDICPHGSLPAIEAFLEWLRTKRSGQYVWYMEHKLDHRYQDIDIEQIYNELKGQ